MSRQLEALEAASGRIAPLEGIHTPKGEIDHAAKTAVRYLKRLLREQSWTQETAAERCGITSRYVFDKLEQGKASASLDTLDQIAAGLQLKPEALLRDPDRFQ